MNAYENAFTDSRNGTADEPLAGGFIALAVLGKEAWNAWRNDYPASWNPEAAKWVRAVRWTDSTSNDQIQLNPAITTFEGFNFGSGADFRNVKFAEGSIANFSYTEFGDDANFQNAVFPHGVTFRGARFGNDTKLDHLVIRSGATHDASLNHWIDLSSVKFGDRCTIFSVNAEWNISNHPPPLADFTNCEIGEDFHLKFQYHASQVKTRFSRTTLGDRAKFSTTHAPHFIYMEACTIGDGASFEGALFNELSLLACKFNGSVSFSGSATEKQELGITSIRDCTFSGNVDFSNRTFTARTTFAGSSFAKVPRFHNSELHQDTHFDESSFPEGASGNGTDSRAYRTLKLAMSKHQATNYEMFFFRKEMAEECEEHRTAGRYTLWSLYKCYRALSNYGESVRRPLIAYAFVCLGFAGGYAYISGAGDLVWLPTIRDLQFHRTAQWWTYSFISSVPIGGLDELGKSIYVQLVGSKEFKPSAMLAAALVIQKILSVLFLFLVGLALRNHFKMK